MVWFALYFQMWRQLSKLKCLLECVGIVDLCRREECCSTVTGAQGYSRWWLHPAARSQSGRRKSASLLLGKRPFQSSAHWWRLRQGSCMARTFQLSGGTLSYSTSQNILLGIFFNSRNTDTHINTYKGNRHIKRGMKGEIQFFILYFTELIIRVLLTSGLYAELKLQVHDVAKINQNYECVMTHVTYGHTWAASRSTWVWPSLCCSR